MSGNAPVCRPRSRAARGGPAPGRDLGFRHRSRSEGAATDLNQYERESFCYLTTLGRVSGNPHEIEIWFALRGSTVYMLSGGGERSDWVRNLKNDPNVMVRLGGETFRGQARVVADPDEEAWARAALPEKYGPTYSGDLTNWSRTALPVAIDILAAA